MIPYVLACQDKFECTVQTYTNIAWKCLTLSQSHCLKSIGRHSRDIKIGLKQVNQGKEKS